VKNLVRQLVVVAMICTFVICEQSLIHAQAKEPETKAELPLEPRQPGGYLSNDVGRYLTIEGVLYDGSGKVESNSLVVDTVNGKKLKKSATVLIKNVRLPRKERCVLKGYELGEMIGSPPALREVAEEQGEEYEEQSSAIWRWRPYFIVLSAVKPDGLMKQSK
jgi:hypothetical protein